MTEFVKREFEELEKFQQRVSRYGLEANKNSFGGHYEGDVFLLNMTTKKHPVKGNKKLIEQLVQDGFQHRIYRDFDNRMMFYVLGFARINTKEVRA